ncbi:hypothetical protein OA90_08745 [Labrenzia sp. OB1]|nr:hypothetical protein OA90_08745 [Labrenzia sp. OB1]
MVSGSLLLIIAFVMYASLPKAGETVIAGTDLSLAPRLVALLLGVLSAVLLLRGLYAFRSGRVSKAAERIAHPYRLVGTAALVVAAALLFEPLGFAPTAALYIFGQNFVLCYEPGEFRPLRAAIVAIVAAAVIWYLFTQWLSMPLPSGIL